MGLARKYWDKSDKLEAAAAKATEKAERKLFKARLARTTRSRLKYEEKARRLKVKAQQLHNKADRYWDNATDIYDNAHG